MSRKVVKVDADGGAEQHCALIERHGHGRHEARVVYVNVRVDGRGLHFENVDARVGEELAAEADPVAVDGSDKAALLVVDVEGKGEDGRVDGAKLVVRVVTCVKKEVVPAPPQVPLLLALADYDGLVARGCRQQRLDPRVDERKVTFDLKG